MTTLPGTTAATDLTILTDISVILKRWTSESVNLGLVCNTYTLPLPSTSIRVLGQGQLSCVVVFLKCKYIKRNEM